MSVQWLQRLAAWVAVASLLSFAVNSLSADVITLNGGGTVHGKVVASGNPKTVALKTPAGALIVFDRQAVKNVKRGADPQPKSPASKAAAMPQLTPEEKAWMPKVHSLVERVYGPDRDQSRRAGSDLLKIDDENAIPALTRYLAASRNDESRRYFSMILANIPGSKAVYYLVKQSLFDRSPNVRDGRIKRGQAHIMAFSQWILVPFGRSCITMPPRYAPVPFVSLGVGGGDYEANGTVGSYRDAYGTVS